MFNALNSWAKSLDQGVLFIILVGIFFVLFSCIFIIYKFIKRTHENKLKKNPVLLGEKELGNEYKIDSIFEKYKVAFIKPYLYIEHPLGEDEGAIYVNLWQISLDARFEAKTIKVVDAPKREGSVICVKTDGHPICLKDAK